MSLEVTDAYLIKDPIERDLACTHCKNKTYTMTQDRPDDFPLMRCAACGSHMGRMGWAYDEPQQATGEE